MRVARGALGAPGLLRALAALGLMGALSLLGCKRAEKWVNKQADEAIAHEIESAADDLGGDKYRPNGLPAKNKKKLAAGSASAATPDPSAAPPVEPPAEPK